MIQGRDGQVDAVDTTTGGTAWKLKGQGTHGQAPSISGNTVYLGGPKLMARHLDEGDFLWKEEARNLVHPRLGFGGPTADGDTVVAVDAYWATRFGTIAGSDRASTEWTEIMGEFGSPEGALTAPAVEGMTVWLPEPDDSAVRVVKKTTREKLFTVRMLREGPYQLVGDAHRVFIARGGRIAAMPVYDE